MDNNGHLLIVNLRLGEWGPSGNVREPLFTFRHPDILPRRFGLRTIVVEHQRSGSGALVVNFKRRIARQICRIILLHFGLVFFRFRFGKTRNPVVFMIFGFLDVSMTLETSYIWLWTHRIVSNNSRNILNHIHFSCKPQDSGKRFFFSERSEKTGTDKYWRSVQ